MEHDDTTDKHPEIVLGEYLAADSPGEWLMDEVGGYLFAGKDAAERIDATEEIFSRVDEERREFVTKQLDPTELVSFCVEVEKSGRLLRASFREFPSPVVLLDMCLRISDPGDDVTIVHTYASGGNVVFEGVWPFGMDWAVRATAPMGRSFAEEEAEEIEALEGMVFNRHRGGVELYDQGDGPRARRWIQAAASALGGALGAGALVFALGARRRR